MAWFRRAAHPEEQLSAYVDGELNAHARRVVEAHLAGCEECSALAEELRQTKSLLAALPRQATSRSFVLGQEYAVQRRAAPRRASFTFAPVAALTVLVALLFVDTVDFSSMSSSSDDAGGAATSGAPAAERQAESADKGAADAGAQTFEGPLAPQGTQTPFSAAGASTDSAASTPNSTSSAAGAVTEPAASTPNPTAAAPPSLDRGGADAGDDDSFFLPSNGAAEDESGGISTLRILEIVAALALVASLAVVYLPRVTRR